MKYIIVKVNFCEVPVVFPDVVEHREVAPEGTLLGNSVVAAGFCGRTPDGVWRTWGVSRSLKAGDRPEDAAILEQAFGRA